MFGYCKDEKEKIKWDDYFLIVILVRKRRQLDKMFTFLTVHELSNRQLKSNKFRHSEAQLSNKEREEGGEIKITFKMHFFTYVSKNNSKK